MSTEVRYRKDGGSDQVGSVDAFKITKCPEGWHLAPLRDWARVMLRDYAAILPSDECPPFTADSAARLFRTRSAAQTFCEVAARRAR